MAVDVQMQLRPSNPSISLLAPKQLGHVLAGDEFAIWLCFILALFSASPVGVPLSSWVGLPFLMGEDMTRV
jgi:hypothetical protein